MVMERLVLQMVSDSESEGNSKIYKRGLVHAALCDGPLKQVSLSATTWVPVGRDVLRRAGSGLGCSLGGGALNAATEA